MRDPVVNILLIAGAIALVGLLAWQVYRVRAAYLSLGAKRKSVTRIIQSTINSRTLFEIKSVFVYQGRILEGGCVAVRDGKLVIDVGPDASAVHWEGRQVEVLFNENPYPHSPFYSFTSKVLRVSPLRGNYALVLSIPKALQANQRRRFVRLSPRTGTILDIQFWYIAPENRIRSGLPLDMPEADMDASTLRLVDISAGGVGIELPDTKMACMDLAIAQVRLEQIQKMEVQKLNTIEPETPPVMVRFILRDINAEQPLELWLTGKILTRKDFACSTRLGILFLSWAYGGDVKTRLSWIPVNPQLGISVLGKWVMRRHYEIYSKLEFQSSSR